MRYEGLTDVQLLDAAGGDADAFGVFFDRHFDTVLAFVHRRVYAPQVAFDLTSETFARALQALPTFQERGGSPPIGWLLVIARNLIIDAQRRGVVADDARRRLGMRAVDLTDGDLERVEDLCAQAAMTERLAEALAELPQEQREAVLASVVDELTYPEIAQQLGCSESVVRKRVSRGLRSMRTRITERI